MLACLVASMATGCHTEQAVVSRSPQQPKFINNVYINPHNRSNATADAIDRTRRTERAKQPTRPVVQYAKQTLASATPVKAVKTDDNTSSGDAGLRKKYSDLTGIATTDINNMALYRFIDKWLGANYKIGGCDASGIDCSGFARRLYSDVYGVDLLRTAMEQFSNCKRIKSPTDAEEGDLVFFHIGGKRISHVGVYLGNNYFVHASTSAGVIISSLEEDYWHKYYAGCGRLPRS